MRKLGIILLALVLVISLMAVALPGAADNTGSISNAVIWDTAINLDGSEIDQPSQTSVLETYARLPILFIQNQGQLDSQVEYYVKTPEQTVYLTPSGMVFDLIRYQNTEAADSADRKAERLAFSLDFVDSNTSPLIEGSNKDGAVVNYLIGNDPQKWHTDIPTFREVTYGDIYPGIDLRLYGKAGYLEYEFVVEPGADIADIALAYAGVDGLDLESNELVVSTTFGDLKQSQPYIYQQIGNDTVTVEGGFSLLGADSYGFEVGVYDAGYPLIIDPSLTLNYSTYLGGSGYEYVRGIDVESGCAYIIGYTDSIDFPTKNPYQTDNVTADVFVSKIDTTESGTASLSYSTYLGGSGNDYGWGIAVESGCAYVTGYTYSTDFPTLNEYQTDPGGTYADAFVTRFNATGDNITYSTYLGGSDTDEGHGIAVDSTGCAYVAGKTGSGDFPTENAYLGAKVGDWDAFVAKLDTTQSGDDSLIYSSYLGGSGADVGYGIAVESGYAYVTGETGATDFPTFNQFQTNQTLTDAFVTRFNATGDNITYSTYLGGSDNDFGRGIAVESGCAYVTGYTHSIDFPTFNQYMADPSDSLSDVFVTKLDTAQSGASSLTYSSYLGGSGDEQGNGIAVESAYAYVTGYTYSTDFPTKNEYQTDPTDTAADAFVAELDTTESGNDSLIFSTYLGGDSGDVGYGIAVESGCAYVTGETYSTDFPTLNQYQTHQANKDAFVTKFGITQLDVPDVVGDYAIKSSIKFYDWKCNKWMVVQTGILHITQQNGHKVKGFWEPGVTIDGWPTAVPVKGYVGPFERDAKLKIKNKPRLSLVAKLGEYCQYPSATYATYILNATIKMDKKTEKIKSMKCTINGWGELSTAFPDDSPSVGQFEGKFTATPIP